MLVRSFLLTLLALVSSPALHAFVTPLDAKLGITLREDPVTPTPEIGARQFFCRFTPPSGLSEPKLWLRFHRDATALEQPFSANPAGSLLVHPVLITSTPAGNGAIESSWNMPWKLRLPEGNQAPTHEPFADGESGFYQWILEHRVNGALQYDFGDIHSFTLPRRLVIAVMGDSFGSGEGAPSTGPKPWIHSAAHRSAVSGSELAIAVFRNNNPHTAFDYTNTTSSGAIAHDIWSATAQKDRDEDGQGIPLPQARVLENWLFQNGGGYRHVDAVILSCGGNDFGFSTMLEHYFGVPRIGLLATAGICAAASLPPTPISPFIFTACMVLAMEADYSFKDGYEAPFVSEGEHRYFSFYEQRLAKEYDRLVSRLGGLSPGAPYQGAYGAQTHNFLVTEYPNPLNGCAKHSDRQGLHGVFIPIRISSKEATEVKTKLAIGTLNTPRPSSGGLNHAIQEMVENINARTSANWRFIQTAHRMHPNGGLCKSGRQFNTVKEAVFMPGPNPGNNAIHPNRSGHSGIYMPAILQGLNSNIGTGYRVSRANNEGLRRGDTLDADLVFATAEITSLDRNTRTVNVRTTVRNGGQRSANGQITLKIRVNARLTVELPFPPTPFPSISPGASRVVEFSHYIPDDPIFRELPFPCFTPGGEFDPSAYSERDLALAYWTGPGASFKCEISTEIPESNSFNNQRDANFAGNPSDYSRQIGPIISNATINNVLADLAAAIDRPSINPAQIDLNDTATLEFFGFSNPVSRWVSENGRQILPGDLFELVDGALIRTDPTASSLIPHLRNFCSPYASSYAIDSRIEQFQAAMYDIRRFEQNLPNDARLMGISMRFETFHGNFFEQTFDIITPDLAVGVAGKLPLEPLGVQNYSAGLTFPKGGMAWRASAGTAPGRAEFFQTTMNSFPNPMLRGEPPVSLEIDGLPADGRTWYLSMDTLREDGTTRNNTYRFETQPRNPRLTFPLEGDVYSSQETVFRWTHGSQPADAYRLWIGSSHGARDVFGTDPKNPLNTEIGIVDGNGTSIGIGNLPQDGRRLFLTLGAYRGGVWHNEHHELDAPLADLPDLLLPEPGSSIGGMACIRLREPNEGVEFVRISLGSTHGGDDLYKADFIPASEDLAWDIELPPPSPEFPEVHLTFEFAGKTEGTQHWVFPRSMNTTLLSPCPDVFTPLRPGELDFHWQDGHEVEGNHITLGIAPGDDSLGEHLALPGDNQANFKIPDQNHALMVYLNIGSVRTKGENGTETYAFLIGGTETGYENDGIDDHMQIYYFGPANPLGRANADADGDGVSNLDEILAGTSPVRLGETWPRRGNLTPDGMLSFPVPAIVSTTRYIIERSSDLHTWHPHGSPQVFESSSSGGTITAPIRPGQENEFYRLRLEPR